MAVEMQLQDGLPRRMFQHPDHEHGPEGNDGLFVPYGLRVKAPERLNVKRWRQTAKLLSPLIGLGVMIAAVWVLVRILRNVKLDAVYSGLSAMHFGSVVAALALVVLSYLCLIGYDLVSLHHLGKRLNILAVAVGGFVSFALANTLGFVLLTAGSVRYRVYGPGGVTAADVAVITIMSGITFALSAVLIMGVALLLAPNFASIVNNLPGWINFSIGLVIVAALGGYIGWISSGRKAVSWSGYEISLPGPVSTLAQLASGVGDMVCAAGALYLLLPSDPGTGFPIFVGLFAVAITLGLLSHVPGGVGVFESIMLLAVPNIGLEKMLASLLVFRVLYYLLPMVVAIIVYAWYEARRAPIMGRLRHSARLARLGGIAAVRSARSLARRIESEFRKRPGSY
jgi:uncharacterized membrane protein YbhN (UPF0104 family)